MQSELKKALRETAKFRGLYEVLRDEKFVGTSQKSSGKSRPEAGRDDGKGDWDGTESNGENTSNTEKESVADSATTKDSSPSTSSDSDDVDSVKEGTGIGERLYH